MLPAREASNGSILLGRAPTSRSVKSAKSNASNKTQSFSIRSTPRTVVAERPLWLPTRGLCQSDVPPECWALEMRQLLRFLCECKANEAWDRCSKRGRVTMYDVNKHFVVPWTEGTGSSIALLMNPELPHKAELMISHTWGEDADELMDALELFCLSSHVPMDTPVFFCTLSLYQPDDGVAGGLAIQEQIALEPFKRVIEGVPRHGMIVVHTTAQDVYTRMWCVHEVDEALEADLTVRGAMSQKFRTKFIGSTPLVAASLGWSAQLSYALMSAPPTALELAPSSREGADRCTRKGALSRHGRSRSCSACGRSRRDAAARRTRLCCGRRSSGSRAASTALTRSS